MIYVRCFTIILLSIIASMRSYQHIRQLYRSKSSLFRSFSTTNNNIEPTTLIPSNTIDYYSSTTSLEDNKIEFGDYNLIASQNANNINNKQYKLIEIIGTNNNTININDKVWIRGRISTVRAKGNACFIVLRSNSFYTIQCVHFKSKEQPEQSKALIKYVNSINIESIVDVYGTIVTADIKSCTQNNVEIVIEKIFTISKAPTQLPFLLVDAARTQSEIDASQESERPFPNVPQVS